MVHGGLLDRSSRCGELKPMRVSVRCRQRQGAQVVDARRVAK
ncbi:hypothetical protein [Lysobacter gummosus]